MPEIKDKKQQCIVSTSLSRQEKGCFIEISHKLDIPYCCIARQLIRYILHGQLGWLDLFEKTNDCIESLDSNKGKKVPLRTTLSPELYTSFVQFVEKKGSTTSMVLRRLVLLYITGKIEWKTIWLMR